MERDPRFYYGWLLTANVIVGLSLGWSVLCVFCFGFFLPALEAEFGWSRESTAFGYTLLAWTAVPATVIYGWLIDRFGIRKILLPSLVGFSACFAAMYFLTSNIWHFYFMLFAMSMIGGATQPLTYSRLLVNWFNRKRGLALGIGLSGVGVGSVIFPALINTLIDQIGWRFTYVICAALVFLVNFPVSWLLIRDHPKDLGLLPDGEKGPLPTHQTNPDLEGFTTRQVYRQPVFWKLVIAFILVGGPIGSMIAHQFPMLSGRSVDPVYISIAATSFGLALISGRVIAGHLMDRFFAPKVSGLFLLAPTLGIALYALNLPEVTAIVAAILIGIGVGVEFDVMGLFVSRYFGRLAFGRIYAAFFIFFQCAAVFSWLLGRSYDQIGSYDPGLWVLCALSLIGAIIIFTLPAYPELPSNRGTQSSETKRLDTDPEPSLS